MNDATNAPKPNPKHTEQRRPIRLRSHVQAGTDYLCRQTYDIDEMSGNTVVTNECKAV